MPYIMQVNRPAIDPHVDALAEAIRTSQSSADFLGIAEKIPPLAKAICAEAAPYGYWGAFAGILNYASTELLLKSLPTRPKIRYWVAPMVKMTCVKTAELFKEGQPTEMCFDARSEMGKDWATRVTWGEEQSFGQILHYVFTNLGVGVMPSRTTEAYWETGGVYYNVAEEFYRRLIAPYETIQIAKASNGDVTYAEYLKALMPEYQKLLDTSWADYLVDMAPELARLVPRHATADLRGPCGYGGH